MKSKNRYEDRERYFKELAETSKAYYLDYVGRFKKPVAGCRVLEIGCGEGGNLLPFAENGCYVAGLDLSERKIENAAKFFAERGVSGDFFYENFLEESHLRNVEKFDIILIHDVIEHIEPEDKAAFFNGIHTYLKPDGIVFFGFPAWHMPFGGHQQICSSKFCKIPFIHLLPSFIYKRYLKLFKEPQHRIDELLSIKRSKMTVGRFKKLCDSCGYKIIDRTLWLISPHYKAKFNLRPVRLCGFLSSIPYLRNFLSTSCFYILKESSQK